MTNSVSYVYKYDNNTYWQISGYIDNFGMLIPIHATTYTFGVS